MALPYDRQILSLPAFAPPGWRVVRENAVAGVVVGVIALPLSIALAIAVGMPPVAGLYTAVFAGVVASVFGGSPYNITGPTAALVPLLASAVLQHGAESLPLIGLMAGVLLLVMSALRVGHVIQFMPRLVILGFTAGIALSLGFGQLNALLGVQGIDPTLEHFHEKTWDTLRHLDTVGFATPVIGVAIIATQLLWDRSRLRRVPSALVAVAGATGATWWLGIDTPTIASRYGDLPRAFPQPSLGFLDAGIAFDVLPIAVSVAILGGVEALLSATVADGMSGKAQRHNPTLELRGQGLANLVAPLMGGIPATAAIARTAAGIRNGASSRLTGVFHSLTVLVLTLAFGGLAGHIPMAALAGILMVVAWRIADASEVVRMFRRAPAEDALILAATMVITLFMDLTYAIGFGLAVSMVLVMKRLVQVPAARAMLPNDRGQIQSVSPELSELIMSRPDIDFFTAQGVLSFHSAAAFEYQLAGSTARPLILRMKDVDHIDASGLITLEGIIEHHQRRGARIVLTAIRPEVRPVLDRFGILEKLGPGNVFEHSKCAIASIEHPASVEHDADSKPGPHEGEAPAAGL